MIRDTNLAQSVSYRDALVRHRLLIPTAARGVYGFGQDFDRVLQGFDAFVTRAGQDDGAEVIRFPTLLPRGDLENSGYLKSFPHLAGFVHAFTGDERSHTDMLRAVAHGGEWANTLGMTDVVLTPAALDTFASFVDARIAPRLAVLEDRAGRIEAELRGAGSTLHVLSRQIGRMRRSRR